MTSVDHIARWLADSSNAHPAQHFPAGQADVDQAGLYAWFADEDGLAMLSAVLGATLPPLIYAGQAGATSSRSGTVRLATLRSRIGGNHLRGNIGSSTFRRTLSAVLFEPLELVLDRPGRLSRPSTAIVTQWMHDHLRLATCACPDRTALAALEEEVLGRLDPPLNLMGMSPTAVRVRLRDLRKRLG